MDYYGLGEGAAQEYRTVPLLIHKREFAYECRQCLYGRMQITGGYLMVSSSA
jgi:hypothetical protein